GAITGHGSEAQILRDLLSFGVATYDEYPDIYNYVGGRLFAQYIEPRGFWYNSHTHHQGSAYGNYRFYWDMWAAFIIRAMSGVDIYNNEARFVPYEWIYTRRPDGQLFRAGDDYIERQQNGFWQLSPAHFMAGNYYGDEYLKHEALRINPNFASFGYTNSSLTPVYILLFNDPDLSIKNYDSLPNSKYFPAPAGYMVARTGWTEGAASLDVLATMKITEQWASNHHHLEAGSFQLYYRGILASDSGCYDSYGTSHDYNYNKRSIAHNTLSIFDPDESFSNRANDGGQRLPANASEPGTMAIWMQNDNYRTGKVLGQEFGPDKHYPEYTYIKGDITKAYSNKVSEVLRSMVFFPLNDPYHPAALIVMDKVTSSNASFKKSFLLHMQQEPNIVGSKTTILNTIGSNNGKMVNETLLPKNALIEAIGGSGRQFMVNGVNYPYNGEERMSMEPGWGRVEISPQQSSLTDYFLNVMTVSAANETAPDLASTLLEGESWVGAMVADHVAIFALDTERIDQPITFTIPGNGVYKVFIAGISEGTWVVSQTAEEITATAEGGAIYFQVGSASNAEEVSVTVSPKATTVSISGQIFSYNQLNPANIRLIQGERLIREITTPPGTDFSPLLQDFAITGITPGIYDLVITKPGHTAFTLLNVEVGSTGLDLTLDTRPEVQLISLWGGDINGDGIVNSIDLTYLLSEFNRAPLLFPYADIDGNGLVNSVDLTYLLAGFNKRDVVIEYAF
ncbi:MAG: heparinase II/III family protein, partial [Clostridiales bacterium]|nr:heparinase II/III family protein [Clostridiales bacterium]